MPDLIQTQIDRLRGLAQRVHAGESIDWNKERQEQALELVTGDAEFAQTVNDRWQERIRGIEKTDDERITAMLLNGAIGDGNAGSESPPVSYAGPATQPQNSGNVA